MEQAELDRICSILDGVDVGDLGLVYFRIFIDEVTILLRRIAHANASPKRNTGQIILTMRKVVRPD
jgi:hypothetical protein